MNVSIHLRIFFLLISISAGAHALAAQSVSNFDSIKNVYDEAVKLLGQSEADLALENLFYLKETIPHEHELTDKIAISIAEAYRQHHEYKKGRDLLYELITKKEISPEDLASAYNRMTALFNEHRELPKQLRVDSTSKYSYLCIQVSKEHNLIEQLASAQNELGYTYSHPEFGDLNKGVELLTEARDNFLKEGLYHNAANCMINLSRTYNNLGNTDKAIETINTAISYFKEEENRYLAARLYFHKASLHKAKREYEKAYKWLDKGRNVDTRYFVKRMDKQIADMAAKYETEKKEKENAILKSKTEIQQIEIKRRNSIIIELIIGVIIISVLLLIAYQQYHRKRNAYKALVKQNKEQANNDLKEITPLQHTVVSNSTKNKPLENGSDIVSELISFFMEEKPYLHNKISLDDLAKQLDTNRSYLSKAINKELNKNFNELVNEYRLKEARLILINPKYDHISMEGIGQMVGFASRSAFYSNFNKEFGISPSYFRSCMKK